MRPRTLQSVFEFGEQVFSTHFPRSSGFACRFCEPIQRVTTTLPASFGTSLLQMEVCLSPSGKQLGMLLAFVRWGTVGKVVRAAQPNSSSPASARDKNTQSHFNAYPHSAHSTLSHFKFGNSPKVLKLKSRNGHYFFAPASERNAS